MTSKDAVRLAREQQAEAVDFKFMDLLGTWQRAQPESSDPAARLRAFVQNHIGLHVEQRHSTPPRYASMTAGWT